MDKPDSEQLAKMLDTIINEVETRWRFSRADNFLEAPPTNDEKIAAVWDALDDINSIPPQTHFYLWSIFPWFDPDQNKYIINPDTRWKMLVYLATAKNICQMLVSHWTAEGFGATINEFTAEDKLSSYQALLSQLVEEFDKKAERLKQTSQKFIQGFKTFAWNPLTRIDANSIYRSFINRTPRIT